MADSPSHLHAAIDRFERRHREDPEGRNFLPLATAYRRLGELDRAEALLGAGLDRHPDYLSAHVELGVTLAAQGRSDRAEATFRRVLSTDPQNLVALRSLAELAAAAGNFHDAGEWYRELLAVDPMSDDAHARAAEMRAAAATEPDPLDSDDTGVGTGEPKPGADDVDAGRDADAADFLPVLDDQPSATWEDAPDPDASRDHLPLLWEPEPAPEAGPVAPLPMLPEAEVGEDEPGDGVGALDDGVLSDELASETLAELYARQGFRDEAAEMYRALIRRRGEQPALVRRLAELEGDATDPSDAEPSGGHGTAEPVEATAEEMDAFAASFRSGFAGEPAGEAPGGVPAGRPEGDGLHGGAAPDAASAAVDPTGSEAGLAEETEEPVPPGEPRLAEVEPEVEPMAGATTAREEAPALPTEGSPSIAGYFGELLRWRPDGGSGAAERHSGGGEGQEQALVAAGNGGEVAESAVASIMDARADEELRSFQAWLRSLKQ